MSNFNIPTVQTQDRNLSIVPRSPIWSTQMIQLDPVPVENYNHQILASGGYWQASISFPASRIDAEDWFANGLGRDITVYSPDGLAEIFNGFVNKIDVNMGTLKATRGPLLTIANRIKCVYSSLIDVDGNIVGVRETTGYANDAVSQLKYGIMETVVSVGGAQPATAENIRDTYLEEHRAPFTTETVTLGSVSNIIVTLTIAGYIQFMQAYTFTDTNYGTRQLSDRVADLLGADPSSRLSTSLVYVDENTLTTARHEVDDRTAWQIMKAVASKGDASFNRWVFGVYENRQMYYNQAPNEFAYFHRIHDNRQAVENPRGVEVEPWNIRPGQWLLVSDWLIGELVGGTANRTDPRALFIENVNYQAPYGVTVNGSKLYALPQIMAQLGLGGASS